MDPPPLIQWGSEVNPSSFYLHATRVYRGFASTNFRQGRRMGRVPPIGRRNVAPRGGDLHGWQAAGEGTIRQVMSTFRRVGWLHAPPSALKRKG